MPSSNSPDNRDRDIRLSDTIYMHNRKAANCMALIAREFCPFSWKGINLFFSELVLGSMVATLAYYYFAAFLQLQQSKPVWFVTRYGYCTFEKQICMDGHFPHKPDISLSDFYLFCEWVVRFNTSINSGKTVFNHILTRALQLKC